MPFTSSDHARHSISRLRLRLHCHDALTQAVQQRASQLFHQRLHDALDAQVEQIWKSSAHVPLRIDRLVLNVGDIEWGQFDDQLCQRVVQQLSLRLRDLLAAHQPASNTPDAATWMRGEAGKAGQKERVLSKEACSDSSSNVALTAKPAPDCVDFIRYLQTGVWSHLAVWRMQSPERWLREQLKQASKEWRLALAFACLQPRAMQRLLSHFDHATLRAIHQVLRQQAVTLPLVSDWKPYLCWAALSILQQERALTQLPATVIPAAVLETPPVQEALPYWRQQARDLLSQIDWPASWWTTLQECLAPIWIQDASLSQAIDSKQSTALRQVADSKHGTALKLSTDSRQVADSTHGPALKLSTAPRQVTNSKHGLALTLSAASRLDTDLKQKSATTQVTLARLTEALHLTEEQPFAVSNAGVVLLWPMLPRLLHQLGVLQEQRFLSLEAQWHAVCCLDWLIWESGQNSEHDAARTMPLTSAEWRAPLTKLLCGIPLEMTAPIWSYPTEEQKNRLRAWLSATLQTWQGLQRYSEHANLTLFIQRSGLALPHSTYWQLDVEQDASDILLSMPPWPMTEIRLPWLDRPWILNWLSSS